MSTNSRTSTSTDPLLYPASDQNNRQCEKDPFSPHLRYLINSIQMPENQGETLKNRDYVVLLVVTLLIPIIVNVIGRLL